MNNPMVIDFSMLALIDYVSLSLLLLAFYYFQTRMLREKNRSRIAKSSLSLANITLTLCLALLVLQPKFLSNSASRGLAIKIVTKAKNENLPSLIDSIRNEKTTFIMQDLLDDFRQNPSEKSSLKNTHQVKTDINSLKEKTVDSPSQIFIRLSQELSMKNNIITSLQIDGDGLTNRQIDRLTSNQKIRIDKVVYQPPTEISIGMIDPVWNKKINLGDSFNLKITLKSAGELHKSKNLLDDQYRLQFIDPVGQIVSEQPIAHNEKIEVSSRPRVSGLHTYKLQLLDANDDIVSTELIPVEVTKIANAKILIMQSSPSFETKQMQNWAAESGALVVLNSIVSKDINFSRLTNIDLESREFYKNIEPSLGLLDKFDLLVLDPRRYLSFTSKQKKTIASSIKNGLGVILLADSSLIKSRGLFSNLVPEVLSINALKQTTKSLVYFLNNENDRADSTLLVSNLPVSLTASSIGIELATKDTSKISSLAYYDFNRILENKNGELLLASYSLGLGKVAVSIVKDTYQWISNGEKETHGQYWQVLVKEVARRKDRDISWFTEVNINNKTANSLSHVNKKNVLCIRSNTNRQINKFATVRPLSKEKTKQRILLNRSPVVADKFCASYWPTHHGWQKLELFGPDKDESVKFETLYFYVHKNDAWSADQSNRRIRSTLIYKDLINNRDEIEEQPFASSYQSIDPWFLWGLIIFSMSFVWIENKIYR